MIHTGSVEDSPVPDPCSSVSSTVDMLHWLLQHHLLACSQCLQISKSMHASLGAHIVSHKGNAPAHGHGACSP
jgi:hypothetical protein